MNAAVLVLDVGMRPLRVEPWERAICDFFLGKYGEFHLGYNITHGAFRKHDTEHLQFHKIFMIKIIPWMRVVARPGAGIFDQVPIFSIFFTISD